MSKKTTAKWEHAIWVDCPKCLYYFDYTEENTQELSPGKGYKNLTADCPHCNTKIVFDLDGDRHDHRNRTNKTRTKSEDRDTRTADYITT